MVPVKEEWVWLRLTATDKAGNTATDIIQVEVPTTIETQRGGTIRLDDQQAHLYFPPRTLAQDEIAVVNALTEVNIELPVRRISPVYDFAPTTLIVSNRPP